MIVVFGSLLVMVLFGSGFFYLIHYIDSIKTAVSEKMETQERHIDHLKAGISQDNIRRRNIIAAEKIIQMVNDSLPYEARLEYASYFVDEVERMPTVDLSLALAIATAESSFRPNAESFIVINGVKKVNAVGIFQFVKLTGRNLARELGIPYDDSTRYDPRINIKMGIYYIQQLIGEYDGNVEMALAHFMDGGLGAEGWSLRKTLSSSSEYNGMTLSDVNEKLRGLGYFDDTTTFIQKRQTPELDKYINFSKAKLLPLQSEIGVPKILRIRNAYIEYFRNADIYFTPSTKAVVDTSKVGK